MVLTWQDYRLLPYERELALREARTLLRPRRLVDSGSHIEATTATPAAADLLTYVRSFQVDADSKFTKQFLLETNGTNDRRRQSTRYSVHGLHDYKGKFNPQVVRALLGVLGAKSSSRVLDPFCGSGTTLVECAHYGLSCVGWDLNPLAVFVSNAKVSALSANPARLEEYARAVGKQIAKRLPAVATGGRNDYLRAWVPDDTLRALERIRETTSAFEEPYRAVLLAIASNLIRDYSLQEPADLRIRKRKSPFPSVPFRTAFERDVLKVARNVRLVAPYLPEPLPVCRSLRIDATVDAPKDHRFDLAITSPPYATALPYIDTQRLSLIWLDLVDVKELRTLEARLVGSREFAGVERAGWVAKMRDNAEGLPVGLVEFCLMLAGAIGADDGFRRQAVPHLLYRYFVSMQRAMRNVKMQMRRGGQFAMIVGHNHTVLGGLRIDIDTPELLAELGTHVGFELVENTELQAYQRFGLNAKNSVARESLIVLKA